MNKIQARIVCLTVLSLLLCTSTASAQSRFTIYYQSGDSIYGITDLSNEPSLIASDVVQAVTFSYSGKYVAYYNAEGVWISATDLWFPEKVISTLPREAFALRWTPDDTRLILSLAFWPEDTDPSEQMLAYNLFTKTAEPWIWGQCDQIAQQILSGDFALVCEAYEAAPGQQPERADSIALEWGGKTGTYSPDEYDILDDIDHFPPAFDWGVTERGQNVVYIPEYSSFVEIVSLWNDGTRLGIGGTQNPDIEFWFAVSPDRSMVAYSVRCPTPLGSCLQITDLETGENLWHYEDTIRVDTVYDIAWYPDNRRVALLGADYVDFVEWRDIIHVFDVETGDSISFDVASTTGTLRIN